MRIFERSHVVDRCRVEDGDVGERAGTQDAPVAETHALRRQARELPDRLFQREQALVANVSAQNTWESSVSTRMYLRLAQRPRDVYRSRICSHAHERLLHRELHIVFAHREVHGSHVVLAGNNHVHQRVERVLMLISGNLRNGSAFVMFEHGIQHRRDQNALRSARAPPHVLDVSAGTRKLLANGGTHLRILEPRHKGRRPVLVVLRRDRCAKRCAGGRVGILIGGNIQTGSSCGLDRGNYGGHLAPVLPAGHFQMPYLHWNFGFAADAKCLVQSFYLAITLVADVGRVDASVFRRHLSQRDQFFGLGVKGGRVDQGSGNTHRTLPHRLLHQLSHAGEFFGSGRAVRAAYDAPSHLRSANISTKIYAYALLLQAAKVAVEITPVYSQVVVLEKIVAVGQGLIVLRSNGPALARDPGGNSLGQLAEGLLVNQQVPFGLLQHVDEAGAT